MPVNTRALPGSHLAPVAAASDGRPVAADERIEVSVYLRGDDASVALTAGAANVDPGARERLADARAVRFASDLVPLSAFADAHGLGIILADAARRLVQISGPASRVQAAFGATLHNATVDGIDSRVRQGTLSLPADLVDRVQAVLGLDTRPIATPKFVPYAGAAAATSHLPTEIAALYNFPRIDASGQCIGIIELGGGYTDADNQAAFAAMGLPVPSVVAVPVSGGSNAPSGGQGADAEVALDIQVAGGAAPGANIAVYFAPNTSKGFVDAITQAVHDKANAPSVISISWGSPESGWSGQAIAAMSAAFQDAAALGVTVCAASGDSLATDGEADGLAHVDFPSSDPAVLGCGGTRIDTAGGSVTGESVWNSGGSGTGGGVSATFPLPAYQAKAGVPATAAPGGRGVPDVSGDADPATGYRIVIAGQTGVIGGTSAVAPLWAALVAQLNAALGKPLGMAHSRLYAASATFHDVTVGNNRVGSVGYSAGPGWDACTGLGSPNGTLLLQALRAG